MLSYLNVALIIGLVSPSNIPRLSLSFGVSYIVSSYHLLNSLGTKKIHSILFACAFKCICTLPLAGTLVRVPICFNELLSMPTVSKSELPLSSLKPKIMRTNK